MSPVHSHDPNRELLLATTTTTTNSQSTNTNREEEYVRAQQAAAEAVLVGRETLEATVSQGEQLQNAENMAEETEYKLDRATRLLRGMTWAGWLANKVTRDVEPPEYNRQKQENNDISPAASSPSRMKSSGTGPPAVYDQAPGSCQAAAQSVQNYSCNLLVLETCETEEQKETCIMICNNMYNMATKEIALLQQQLQKSNGGVKDDDNVINFVDRLVADMKTLRVRQLKSQHLKRGITKQGDSSESPTKSANQSNNRNQVASLTENSPSLSKSTAASPPKVGDLTQTQQEEHLDTMAYHLGELNQLASNLSHSLLGQTETIDSLEDKTESMLFKSRMNTRRADRLIQKKSWTHSAKREFAFFVSIRHLPSGKYLAVSHDNGLLLSAKYNETCIFGLWKRQGEIFGLQSKYSKRWAGQSLLGNLACSANTFGRREEWDAEDDWKETPLLVTSAGWGNGGYLLVRPNDETVAIGGSGLQDKKEAALWCIAEQG